MTYRSNPIDKLIVALDGMDRNQVLTLVSKVPDMKWVKVGLELFVRSGPEILVELKELDLKIFLDLKFHDIPSTMASACIQAVNYGVDLMTVHACAGQKALEESQLAVVNAASKSGFSAPKLLAVTVLTSWNSDLLKKDLFIDQDLSQRVQKMASMANSAGMAGCICSPLEVKN